MSDTYQLSLIQKNLNELKDRLPEARASFYEKLFLIDPSVKSIFSGIESLDHSKFVNMLSTLARAKDLDKIAIAIQALGKRHARYGVSPYHFESVKQCLMAVLHEFLADRLTAEAKQAWSDVYDEVTGLMLKEITPQEYSQGKQKQSIKVDVHADSQLLENIGGAERITPVHRRFYDWIFDDAWLGPFFYGKDKETLIRKQTEFMMSCFGGPNNFTGETPAIAHMHMFIDDEIFNLRQFHLHRCILEEGFSEEIAQRWIRVDESFRQAMVRSKPSECVMRCVGQMPIMVKKPTGYPWPLTEKLRKQG
jgi:hemoglobin-like flavoprotein